MASVVLNKSWNEDAGHSRRDRGAEQKAYQADTPLWSNEEHGEKVPVFVSRLVQHDTSVVPGLVRHDTGKRVGFSGRAWMGLLAGLGIRLVLSAAGLCLGWSFLVSAQESRPSGVTGGPPVSIKLQQGGTVRGALLESRNGWVRLQVEGETSERLYAISDVAAFDFSPAAAVEQTEPKPDSVPSLTETASVDPKPEPKDEPKTAEVPVDRPRDEPRRPLLEPFFKRRQFAEDRRKRILELIKQRSDERLTPEERKRMHELVLTEGKLGPAERQELEQLRRKMGLMEPELFRRTISEVMDEAKQAQRKNELNDYAAQHLNRLSSSVTDEERRRHVASLFAATYVGARDSATTIREIALALMRSTRSDPGMLDEKTKELRLMFDIFLDEVEKSEAPPLRGR